MLDHAMQRLASHPASTEPEVTRPHYDKDPDQFPARVAFGSSLLGTVTGPCMRAKSNVEKRQVVPNTPVPCGERLGCSPVTFGDPYMPDLHSDEHMNVEHSPKRKTTFLYQQGALHFHVSESECMPFLFH